MSLVVHVFRKDFRRLWPLAALACVILAIEWILPLSGLATGRGLLVTHVLPLFYWILVFVTIVALIQEDPAAGNRGAWLTRPIPALCVAGAKFLFIAVLVILPAALAAGAAALWLGASGGLVTATVLSALLTGLLGSLYPAVLGAAVSSMNRLAGFFVAGLFALGLYALHGWGAAHDLWGQLGLPAAGVFHRDRVAEVLTVLALGLAFAYQYQTRRTCRTAALALTLILASLTLARYGPIAWISDSANQAPSSELRLTLDGRYVSTGFTSEPDGRGDSGILVSATLNGMPANRTFDVSSVHAQLVMEDGEPAPVSDKWTGTHWNDIEGGNDPEPAVREALQMPLSPSLRTGMAVNLFSLPTLDYGALRGLTGRLSGTLDLVEVRFRPGQRLTARAGEGGRANGGRWRIWAVDALTGGACKISLAYSGIDSPGFGTDVIQIDPFRDNVGYVLINRSRGEFSISRLGRREGSRGLGVCENGIVEREFVTRSQISGSGTADGIDAAWLAGAELELLGTEYVGHVRASFTCDAFVMPKW